MFNMTAYTLGSNRSCIRELFEYGCRRAAGVGRENVYDYSLGNPSIPAPAGVNEAIAAVIAEMPSLAVHGYTSAPGDMGVRKAIADYLCLRDEEVDDSDRMTIFDPDATWKKKVVYDFNAKELLVPIFYNGHLVYRVPELTASRAYCQRQVDALWDEVKRFENPHNYYVDLSQNLWNIKQDLLKSHGM